MSDTFVVKKVVRRRRRLVGKPVNTPTGPTEPTEPTVPSPTPTPSPAPIPPIEKSVAVSRGVGGMPGYLLDPPDTPGEVGDEDRLDNHTNELICSFRVAQEVLGSSFRPSESNLAVGIIRV